MSLLTRLLMLVLALVPALGVAQGANLKLDSRTGYDGFYRPGAWTPVVVTLDNSPRPGEGGEDFVGSLMVMTNPLSGPQMRFATDVDLPATSRKRYTVYARFPGGNVGGGVQQVFLNLPNGKRVLSVPLNMTALDDNQLLAVTVGDGLQRPMLPTMGPGLDRLMYARVAAAELPESSIAWASVDVVVMDGWPAEGVSKAAAAALQDWVRGGGTLVFLGGQHARSYVGETAEMMLPVAIRGSSLLVETAEGMAVAAEDAPLPPDARKYAITVTTPKAGSRVLAELGETPAAVLAPLGAGRTIFFANDFKSDSRRVEEFFRPAWLSVVPIPSLTDGRRELPATLQKFKSLTGRAARAPNSLLIALVCALYIIIVGPVNFLYLQKKGRLEWAWFTLPVIVFVFFFLSYGIGQAIKGNIRLVRELTIERYRAGETRGTSALLVNTFTSNPTPAEIRPVGAGSTLGDAYPWNGSPSFLDTLSMGALADGFGAQVGSLAPMISYDTEKDQVHVTSWSMGTFEATSLRGEGPAEMAGAIDSYLVWTRSGLTGSLVNRTGVAFEDAFLRVGGEVLPIGKFADGATFDLGNRPGGGYVIGGAWVPLAKHLDSWLTKSGVPEDGLEVARNNAAQWLLDGASPRGTGLLFPPDAGRVSFVGFRQNSKLVHVETNLEPDDWSSATLAIVDLTPRPAPGIIPVPGEYVPLRVLGATIDAPGGRVDFEADGRLKMSSSTIVFLAELPFMEPNARITQFRIQTNLDPVSQYQTVFEVFDLARRNWVVVEPNTNIPNANNCVLHNGRMMARMRVVLTDNQSSNYWYSVGIRQLGISMEAEVQ